MRGYGGTEAPAHFADYNLFTLVGDMLGLLAHLGIEQSYLVGHDHGARFGMYCCRVCEVFVRLWLYVRACVRVLHVVVADQLAHVHVHVICMFIFM